MTGPLLLCLYLGAANLTAFAAFGLDKQRARSGAWRIKESTLLGLALIGGTGGAYLGRSRFRHKTRKRNFSRNLHLIALVQAAVLAWLWTQPIAPYSTGFIPVP